IGFRKKFRVFELERRHLAVRILGEECCARRFPLDRIDLDPAVGQAELLERQLDLVAVARVRHSVHYEHAADCSCQAIACAAPAAAACTPMQWGKLEVTPEQ